jgi:hypothetical protein
MAKKEKVNKTKAVGDYWKAHPKATASEISEALGKQGVKLTPAHVANIKSNLRKRREERKGAKAKVAAVLVASPAQAVDAQPAVKPSEGLTIQHVKAVAQTVKMIGGFERLKELLEVIREVGGLKKFRDLMEAMTVTESNKIPF